MAAKEETGDAKHMAMSHDHRIPPDPYAIGFNMSYHTLARAAMRPTFAL